MKFIADFHIHSKYSRATSRDMDLENLDKWAQIKGIKVLSAADFTHPEWLKNLKEKLAPAENGLFKLKPKFSGPNSKGETRFILTTEISCIYSQGGQVRKIHIVIFAPDFTAVDEINRQLEKIGNLHSDGRPILGLSAKDLTKIVLDASPDCLVVPAHAWTPWFSVFGSKSGFDSLEECFGEYAKNIFAIETGLSSDPAMNWQVSALDKITLISNSDAHSPRKIGREANIFDTEISYSKIAEAIKQKDPKKFLSTIEFFPEEGKYHYDGHRDCGVSLTPEETKKYGGICPVCGKELTIGVFNRVNELADRKIGSKPAGAMPFCRLIPLEEIIADVFGLGVASKKVQAEYQNLIKKLGNEFGILLDVSLADLAKNTLPEVAQGIIRVREGKVSIVPGYDGVFGQIKIFSKTEKQKPIKQETLF
jgi:DNA helicase II / ATP-dependent DNA helicase PcrA